MGVLRSAITFLIGALGGAGAAAYLLTNQQPTSERLSSFGSGADQATRFSAPAPMPAGSKGGGDQLQNEADLQRKLADQEQLTADLRLQLTRATGWQAKTPALTRLGQTLARLPSFKAAAADAAIGASVLPAVTGDCHDLAAVHGIGAAYEQRMYTAGVGTYWEIAHLTDDDFLRILRPTHLQRSTLDTGAIRADARRLAAESDSVGLLWSGDTPDDLEPIKGIGPVFEQKLYDAGIRTYRALANATVDELAAICGTNLRVQPDFADWIAQAQRLAAERGAEA